MALRTTLVAPDAELLSRASICAERFRNREWGTDERSRRNSVLVALPGPLSNYAINIWGDPAGHVRAYAYRTKS